MSTHTPGPWEAHTDGQHWDVKPENMKGIDVCYCDSGDILSEDVKANAHLIAAAPELLEALKDALPLIDDAEQEARLVATEAWLAVAKSLKLQADFARAAIAKAEGRE